MRPQIRVCLPELQALAIDGLGIPRRIMHEVMQPLALGPRNEGRQLDQRLVVLSRQQESNEIVTEGLPLLPSREQRIKTGTELINRLGGRSRRLAGSGHQNASSLEQNPCLRTILLPSLAAGSVPDLINQRLARSPFCLA